MKKKEVDFLGELLGSMSDPFYLSYRFIALGELVTQRLDELYKQEVGIGIKELRILRLAQLHPGQPVAMIGRWTFIEKAMMSKLVSRLCDLGYLERRINGDDARSTQLFATKTGATLVRAADKMANKLFQRQFPLPPEARAPLIATLDAILLNFATNSVTSPESGHPDSNDRVARSKGVRRRSD